MKGNSLYDVIHSNFTLYAGRNINIYSTATTTMSYNAASLPCWPYAASSCLQILMTTIPRFRQPPSLRSSTITPAPGSCRQNIDLAATGSLILRSTMAPVLFACTPSNKSHKGLSRPLEKESVVLFLSLRPLLPGPEPSPATWPPHFNTPQQTQKQPMVQARSSVWFSVQWQQENPSVLMSARERARERERETQRNRDRVERENEGGNEGERKMIRNRERVWKRN